MNTIEASWRRACSGDAEGLALFKELAEPELLGRVHRLVPGLPHETTLLICSTTLIEMERLAATAAGQFDGSVMTLATARAETALIDHCFDLARARRQDAFPWWASLVEPRLRRSLGRFRLDVDVEAVVQETLLRMWIVAQERDLEGAGASLRFALRVAGNLAIDEVRLQGRFIEHSPEETLHDNAAAPLLPDPGLREAILSCVELLPKRPQQALRAKLSSHALTDDEIAANLKMQRNTFHQNIRRARDAVRDCLAGKGITLDGGTMRDRDTDRDALIEQAAGAFRERDLRGRIRSSPAWWDLSPADRDALYQQQLESRQLERAVNRGGLNTTVQAVTSRIGR